MTESDEQKAAKIVASWYWQMAEGHNFRWKGATKSMTLFYESSPLESDMAQLVIEYLKSRESITEFVIANKKWTFDTPWNAKDCWYQTMPSEKWAGTESTKVRVYWALIQNGDEAADGPYVVEDGCKYKVSHSYFWDVSSEPSLPASESGVQYSIQGFTRDRETGLFTYIVEKRETVQQDVALYDTAVTAFELSQEEQHLGVKANAVASTGRQAGVASGVRTERKVTKNPDCTSDVVNRVTTEKNVKGAVKTWRKTLRGTVESTTERSAANPLNGSGLQVGETRRSEQTPGELWNNTVEKTTTEPAGEIGSECQKTIFEHRDVTVENVPTAPAKEADEAANGVLKQKTIRKTEENTYDVTDTTTRERKVEDARTVERKTLRGTSAATTHRNLTAAEVAAKTGAQLDVGETRTVEKTPGDLKNLTIEKFEPDTQRIKIAESCEKTAAVETDTTVESVKVEEIGTVHPQTAEVNKRKSVSYRKNDDGKTADRTIVVEKHEMQTAAGGGGSTGSTTATTRIQNATAQEPAAPGGVNKVVDVDNTPNGMGGFNTVKRVTTFHPDSRQASGGTTSRTVTVESGINQTAVPSDGGGVNKEVDVSVSLNDHGSMSTQKRVTTFHPDSKMAISNLPLETVETVVKINATEEPRATFGSASVSPNDHGSATTSVTKITPKPLDSGWVKWTRTVKSTRGKYTYKCGLRVFRNQETVPGMTEDHDYHPSVSINQYGLYDGSITYADLDNFEETGGAGGAYGGIQTGYIEVNGEKHETRVFYGQGNEGTEAKVKANQVIVKGVNLPARTYFVS